MSSLEQVAERALDDIIVALVIVEAGDPTRWRNLEAAANRLRKAAREIAPHPRRNSSRPNTWSA